MAKGWHGGAMAGCGQPCGLIGRVWLLPCVGIAGATYCHAGVCWALWLAMEGLCDHGVVLEEASGSFDFYTGGIVCAWVGHGLGLQVHGIS